MQQLFDGLMALTQGKTVPSRVFYEALAESKVVSDIQRLLAKSIAERVGNLDFFVLRDSGPLGKGQYVTQQGLYNFDFSQDSPQSVITLENPKNTISAFKDGKPIPGYDGADGVDTAIHEGLHSVTVRQVKDNESEFSQEIQDIWRTVLSYIKDGGSEFSNHPIVKSYRQGGNNAFQNIYELIAWGMTNAEMMDLLRSIPYKTNRSVWGQFIQSIRQMLGLPDTRQVTNALEGLFNAYALLQEEEIGSQEQPEVSAQGGTSQVNELLAEEDRIKQEIIDERNVLKSNLQEIADGFKGDWRSKGGVMSLTLKNGGRFEITKREDGDFDVVYYDTDGMSYPETAPTKMEAISAVKENVKSMKEEAMEDFKEDAESLIDDLKEQLKEVRADIRQARKEGALEMRQSDLLAPNGEPSNLTPEQHRIVRTPEFKAWFGDWENDTTNASKAVDENGEPLVVYHGSPATDITSFESGHSSSGLREYGWYFATNARLAELYGYQKSKTLRSRVYPVFLNIRDMSSFDAEGNFFDKAWNMLSADVGYKTASGRSAMEALSGNNTASPNTRVDGVKAENIVDVMDPAYRGLTQFERQETIDRYKGDVYLVWFDSPQNIKLADGSNTTFDPSKSGILEMRQGMLPGDADSPMRFDDDLDIYDVIERGRKAGFRDDSILEYLRRNGFTLRESRAAMEIPLDITTSMPAAFGNVPGGAKVGYKMYQEIKAELREFAKKKGNDAAAVRAEAQRLLKERPEFKAASQNTQVMMLSGMDQTLQGKRNKRVSDAIKRMRADMKQRMVGAREVRSAQAQLKKFIEANLPEKMRNKAKVKALLKRLSDANFSNMPVVMAEVEDILNQMVAADSKLAEKANVIKERLKTARENAKGLKMAKAEARIFIRKNLPVGKYGKRTISKLITMATNATPDTLGKDGQLTENSISRVMEKVVEEVNKHTSKNLMQVIENIFKGDFVTISGDRVKGRISVEAQERLAGIKSLMVDPKSDVKTITDSIASLNETIAKLMEQERTDEVLDRMSSAMIALSYNQALLSEDTEAAHIALLEEVAQTLTEMFIEGRNELKERLSARHQHYNSLKSRVFKDATGGLEIDFNDADSKQAAMKEVKTRQNKKENRSNMTKILLAPFTSLDSFIAKSEDLAGIVDRISKMPGEIFGGETQEVITQAINEASNEFKDGKITLMLIVQQKASEIYGKNYRKVMEANGLATEFYYIDPAEAEALEEQIANETDKGKRRKLEERLAVLRKPISQNEMYYLYNQYKDPANHPGFSTKFDGNHEAIMAQIESKLDPQVREWADWQVNELFPSLYDRYNEVYRAIYDTNMPWNEFYAGRIIREGDHKSDKVVESFLDGDKYRAHVGSASTKLRQQNNKAIKTRNGDTALNQYLSEMEFFRAYAEPMRDISKVINSPEVSEAIIAYGGRENFSLLKTYIDRVMSQGIDREDSGLEMFDKMTNAFVTSKLGLSPQVFMKQMTSALAFQSFIGTRNWMLYSTKAMSGGIGTLNKYWQEWYANSPELQDRYENNAIMRVLENYSDKESVGPITMGGKVIVGSQMKDNVIATMMWLVKQGDKMGVMGGIANYLYYKEQFLKDNPNATEQDAMTYAAKKAAIQANKTQQSSNTQDKDYFQTGNKGLRFLSMFQSSARALWRMETNAFRQLFRAVTGKAYKGTVRGAVRDIMLYHVMLPMLVQFITNGLQGLLREPDDDDKYDMLRAALLGNFNSVFVLGQLAVIARDRFTDAPWAGELPSLPILIQANDVIDYVVKYSEYTGKAEELYKYADRKEREEYELKASEQMEKAVIALGEVITGIPVGNINKLSNNLQKIGESEDTGETVMRLLNYSEYTIQRGKPEEKKTKGMSKRDMKMYFPEMYEDLYGEGGALYDIEQDKKEMRQELREMEKEAMK